MVTLDTLSIFHGVIWVIETAFVTFINNIFGLGILDVQKVFILTFNFPNVAFFTLVLPFWFYIYIVLLRSFFETFIDFHLGIFLEDEYTSFLSIEVRFEIIDLPCGFDELFIVSQLMNLNCIQFFVIKIRTIHLIHSHLLWINITIISFKHIVTILINSSLPCCITSQIRQQYGQLLTIFDVSLLENSARSAHSILLLGIKEL